jgi:PKD repeat protein
VSGNILDRGQIIDMESGDLTTFDTVEYGFQLITSEQEYLVSYSNKSSTLSKGDVQINLTSSNYSVTGDTLTVTFDLVTPNEAYENLTVTTTFIKADLNNPDPSDFVYLSDIAPNPPLEIYTIDASNIGSVGETIQFNGSVAPFTGQPPYSYHWDFGDQGTSTNLNPTHAYTKAGTYTYTFTVTDQADVSVSETGTITISSGEGSNGSISNQMLLFLAILVIIIIVGIVIIVWIIRR